MLRLEVFGLPGQPTVSLSSDGHWLYILTRNPAHFDKRKIEGADLSDILSIPIRTEDIYHMLSGRVPLLPHRSAEVSARKAGVDRVLVLKSFWGNPVEKIHFTDTGDRAFRVDVYRTGGRPAYRAHFEGSRQVGAFRVPEEITVTAVDGSMLKLDIDRYLANMTVQPSVFILHPPGNPAGKATPFTESR